MAVGRFAGEALKRAWQIGRPSLTDVGMNAVPSLIYGASMMSQGANPAEALGTAGFDLGLQMGMDAGFGTAGAALADSTAPTGTPNSRRLRRARGWSQMAKMGSMASMMIPNPVANSFYDRRSKEMAAREQSGLYFPPGMTVGPVQSSPRVMSGEESITPYVMQQAAAAGLDLDDPLVRAHLESLVPIPVTGSFR